MMYIEINTGFVLSGNELRNIWRNLYDGDDDTNAVTFDEFLQGLYYETATDGTEIPCVFEPFTA